MWRPTSCCATNALGSSGSPWSFQWGLSVVWRDAPAGRQGLKGRNGLTFSPDEKYLYVGNWDEKNKVVMRYTVKPDSTLANGEVFFDVTNAPGEDAIDGVMVDERGNVYVSGPGGLWILSPDGKHLGTTSRRSIYTTSRGGMTVAACM